MFPHLLCWAHCAMGRLPRDLTFAREVSPFCISPSKQKLNSTQLQTHQANPCPARFLTKNTLVNYISWSHRNRVQPHLCVPCSVLVVQQFPPSNTVPVTKTWQLKLFSVFPKKKTINKIENSQKKFKPLATCKVKLKFTQRAGVHLHHLHPKDEV